MAGHVYTFRFNYRADQMQVEKPDAGTRQRLLELGVVIEWSGTGIAPTQRYTGALDRQDNSANWKQETNSSARYQNGSGAVSCACGSDDGHSQIPSRHKCRERSADGICR